MSVIGIDLGTTNSLVAVFENGTSKIIRGSAGEVLTPSAVSVDEDGLILVGAAAKERAISHPQHTATDFKRFMGTDKQFILGDKRFTAEALSSFVLRKLVQDAERYLGTTVSEAIISVPAYFNNRQRDATKAAAALAGLACKRIVNEPSAAALAVRMLNLDTEECYLVFDFGGGTLDISVVDCFENIIEIVAVCGDNHLGGIDFDLSLATELCRRHSVHFDTLDEGDRASLLKSSALGKEALSRSEKVLLTFVLEGTELSMPLSNGLLIELNKPLFSKMKALIAKVLLDSGRTTADITDVIMVGGSCHMPCIREFLTHTLQRQIRVPQELDLLVAKGIGNYIGIKERAQEIEDLMMTDVCPFSLGVDILNRNERLDDTKGSLMSFVIERNSVLPTEASRRYVTARDNQDRMHFEIYQGENYYVNQNIKIGEISIDVPKAPAGREGAIITFRYDINSILDIKVVNSTTGNEAHMVIQQSGHAMTPEQIEQKRNELDALRLIPYENEENRAAMAYAERLYSETSEGLREHIGFLLDGFHRALCSSSPIAIVKARRDLLARLHAIEQECFGGLLIDED